jgi:hypothetical protein
VDAFLPGVPGLKMPVSRKRPGHRQLVEDRAKRQKDLLAKADRANRLAKATPRKLPRSVEDWTAGDHDWWDSCLAREQRLRSIRGAEMSDPNQGKPAQPDPSTTQAQTPQPGQPGQVQAGAPSPHLQQPGQVAAGQVAQPGQPQQHPELKRGSQGDAVRELQGRLQVPWLKQDGDFGEATEQAVKAYQQSQGLAADGVVGPETWAKLDHVVGGVTHG